MACPFFVPHEILNDGSWPHPARLPLGAGWQGVCAASGKETPVSENQIRDCCNLGYASACPELPRIRDWDAIRFSVANSNDEHLTLWYSCERSHAPVEHGTLTYDVARKTWRSQHRDERVNRLAESYLHAIRARHTGAPAD